MNNYIAKTEGAAYYEMLKKKFNVPTQNYWQNPK